MKVEYIYHSGFSLETDDYYLIFDYYKGDLDFKDRKDLKNKKILVFVTHGHHDHFNPEIFNWQEDHPNIKYILSSDIDLEAGDNIFTVAPYEELKLDGLEVKTYGSTDLGVSFFIKLGHKNIFHAGDLNWWHWENDSREDQLKEEKNFKDEVAKIEKVKIDLAFCPVDPRLGQAFSYGGQHYIEVLKPMFFFPMHFGDDLETTERFARDFQTEGVKIMEIDRVNQVFDLS